MNKQAKANREAQRKWYESQKSEFGRIYRITNVITGDTYLGITKNSLKKRWQQHLSQARAGSRSAKLYANIRMYGKECFEVKEVQELDINSNGELLLRQLKQEESPKLNDKLGVK